MKVTVCFGTTKVVVPCGDGNIFVSQLIEEAIQRYKKATRKPADSWVRVNALKSLSDGGILDVDDKLRAVVDDKEQVLAIFDEEIEADNNNVKNNLDYQSGRYSADPDPITFYRSSSHRLAPSAYHGDGDSDSVEHSVEITNLDNPPRSGLLVVANEGPYQNGTGEKGGWRAGSTFVVNGPSGESESEMEIPYARSRRTPGPTSGRAETPDQVSPRPSSSKAVSFKTQSPDSPSSGEKTYFGPTKAFSRGGGVRQSSLAGFLDPSENISFGSVPVVPRSASQASSSQSPLNTSTPGPSSQEFTITIPGSKSTVKPLGIHVEAVYAETGRKLKGVRVTQIEEKSRVKDDGRLELEDVISEIGERPVYQMSLAKAKAYLHEASTSQAPIEFKVIREGRGEIPASSPAPPTPRHPAPLSALQKANTKKIGQKMGVGLKKGPAGLGFTVTSRDTAAGTGRLFYIKTVLPRGAAIEDGRLQAGDRLLEVNGVAVSGLNQRAVVDMLRAVEEGTTAELTISRIGDASASVPNSPDREEGPGTSENIPTSSSLPTSISNQKNHSAASSDQKSQSATTSDSRSQSRAISFDKRIGQDEADHPSIPPIASPLPRPLPPTGALSPPPLPLPSALHPLNLQIPLNSTGSAGLGISVKGRTTASAEGNQRDCRIFIKSIMHGGAAHKDGRLHVNDQLIAVNETSFEGFSNEDSLAVLRKAMQGLDPSANSICLKVLRYSDKSSPNSMLGNLPHSPKRYTVPSGDFYSTILKSPTVQTTSSGSGVIIIEGDTDGDTPDYHQPERTFNSINVYEDIRDEDRESVRGGEDPFNRESTLRQSISEKRHMGAHNNPSHSLTYQKIKHSRQTSAPSLSVGDQISALPSVPPPPAPVSSHGRERRSMSLESLNQVPAGVSQDYTYPVSNSLMVHEFALQGSIRGSGRHPKEQKRISNAKKANRQRPTNDSFRNAVDRSYQSIPGAEVGVDIGGNRRGSGGGNTLRHSLPRDNKSDRRKSSPGSSLFAKLRLSGHSREASPEKKAAQKEKEAQERANRAAQEEHLRIRAQYEKLKRQQDEELKRMRVPSPHVFHGSQWSPGQGYGGAHPPPYYHSGPPPPHPPAHQPLLRGPYAAYPVNYPPQLYYAPRNEYEEPPWFPVSNDRRRFYRSLERDDRRDTREATVVPSVPAVDPRQRQPWGSRGDDGRRTPVSLLSKGGGGRGEGGRGNGPPLPHSPPPSMSITDEPSRISNPPRVPSPPPDYAGHLRPKPLPAWASQSGGHIRTKPFRPSSNYYDYTTSQSESRLRESHFVNEREDGSRTILSSRAYPEKPEPKEAFVMRM